MLSTANYTVDENIKRSGEVLAPADLEMMRDPSCKVYYHRVKGAKTHMPDGAEIQFLGGMFATTNADIQKFLDAIADKPTSQVYTMPKSEERINAEIRQAALAAMVPAGDQRDAQGNIDSTVAIEGSTLQAAQGSESASVLNAPPPPGPPPAPSGLAAVLAAQKNT